MSTETESLVKLHYPVIAPLIMSSGVGDGKTTACVMAQAATIWALSKGKTLDKPTDELHCACPFLRRLAIRANDAPWWKDDMERTEHLRPLIPLLLDSKKSQEITWRRIFFVADNVVHKLTPMRLKFIAAHTKNDELKNDIADGIAQLKAIPAIVDKASCEAARKVCEKLHANAYANADANAYANANADVNAYAYANANAYAYANANADANAYAYANAYANANADAQQLKYRTEFLKLFREVAAITA